MTGAEHYAKAEADLASAESQAFGSAEERYFLAAAQVHALLAMATPGFIKVENVLGS